MRRTGWKQMHRAVNPLRVAIIEETAQIGGAQTNILNLVQAINAQAVELHVFVPYAGPYTLALQERGAILHILNLPRFRSISFFWAERKLLNPAAIIADLFLLLAYAFAIRRAVRQHKIDLLHTNSILAHFAGGVAARLSGRPCIWYMQDIIEPRHRLRRWLFRQSAAFLADGIVTISPPVSQQFGPPLQNRITLLPYGLNVERFRTRAETHDPLRAFAGNRLLIGLAGRFVRWKGQHIFLEAARLLSSVRRDLAFVLIGDASLGEADYASQLRSYVEQHQLDETVLFAGWQPAMPQVYAQLDVAVLASIEPEPFGLVVLEAMASGLPVIATAHGGPAHFLEDGVTGLLIPPSDAAALTQAIVRLADDEDLRGQLSARARREVEEHYTIGNYCERLTTLYRSLCPSKPAPH